MLIIVKNIHIIAYNLRHHCDVAFSESVSVMITNTDAENACGRLVTYWHRKANGWDSFEDRDVLYPSWCFQHWHSVTL